jgi:hypothetical protein
MRIAKADRWYVLLFVTLGAACDPGWHYGVPGGRPIHADGLRYDLMGPMGTNLRIYGSMFAGRLTVELEVQGRATDSIVLTPTTIIAVTARGDTLPSVGAPWTICGSKTITDPTILAEGTRCLVHVEYQSGVNTRALRNIALTYRGLAQGSMTILTSVALRSLSPRELSEAHDKADATH